MRVVLEVTGGMRRGQRRSLQPGHGFVVGRSEFADLACQADDRMSRKHFMLSTDDVGCVIEDAGSRNGTSVNEVPLHDKALLRDGDVIRAGHSKFIVHIEGDDPDEAVNRHSTVFIDDPYCSELLRGLKGRLRATYAAENCNSGLHLYTGFVDDVSPAVLAELLSHNHEAYLIVSPGRAGLSRDALPRSAAILFDFLPSEAAAEVSPWLVAAYNADDWTDLVSECWGRDAVVVLHSRLDKEDMLPAIRRAMNPGGANQSGIVGVCWPAVLAPLLSHDTTGVTQPLRDVATTILMESPDLPDMWQLFSGTDIREKLNGFGLTELPAVIASSEGETTDDPEANTFHSGEL